MDKCQCGKEFKLPALFIGYTEYHIPVAQYQCSCGTVTNMQINGMKPFKTDRTDKFPPPRGEYIVAEDGSITFTCPVCKGFSPIAAPIHSVGPDGAVSPSVVCPYGCGFHVWMTLKDWVAP